MHWSANLLLSILMNYLNTLGMVCPASMSPLPDQAGVPLRGQVMPKLFPEQVIPTQPLRAKAGESLSA